MSDMIQRYEEEAEAFYQATGVMAPGKDAAAAMHGYDADELRHKLWRMWARAVYAERERDDHRQRAERAERSLATLEGWLPDDVDRQYDALYTLCGDSDDSTIRCAVANLRNANRIIRAALVAAEQEVGRE